MISFAKVTKSDYNTLTPVTDRLYLIEDTGELFLNGKTYNGATDGTRDWLCLTALEANSRFGIDKKNYPTFTPSWEYSFDGITWTPYTWYDSDGGIWGTVIWLANIGDKVYLRGDNNVPTCAYENNTEKYYQFSMVGSIAVSGNIMSLLDKTCQRKDIPQTNSHGFAHLFQGCPITTPPKLPATTLSAYAYYEMFRDCSSMTVAPELPATELQNFCYGYMFRWCTSLHVAPELPATIMTEGCYYGMFYDCTGLWQCPELPSVNLAAYCYNLMFAKCSDLGSTMAELPGTSARTYCYGAMFKECTGIRSTPKIRLVSTNINCMSSMFEGCSNLRFAEDLEIIDAMENCCYKMFYNCFNLRIAPSKLLPETIGPYAYNSMFYNCSTLKIAPEIWASTVGNFGMQNMFRYCGNIRYIRLTNLTTWQTTSTNPFDMWVGGVSSYRGVFECPVQLPYTFDASHIPQNWMVNSINRTSPYDNPASLENMWYGSSDTDAVEIAPSQRGWYELTVNSRDVTLNAVLGCQYKMGYANVVIELFDNYTVNAGTNITFADQLTPNKANYCVVRWTFKKAILYVVDVQDNNE